MDLIAIIYSFINKFGIGPLIDAIGSWSTLSVGPLSMILFDHCLWEVARVDIKRSIESTVASARTEDAVDL